MADTNANISAGAYEFRKKLLNMLNGFVWKDLETAYKYEGSVKDQNIIEDFLFASEGLLTFEIVYAFPEEVITLAGYGQSAQVWSLNKLSIPSQPVEIRRTITDTYIDWLLDTDPITGHYTNYIEENNYYRMLSGLPDIDDTDFVYVQNSNVIDSTIPVHELSVVDRFIMDNNGISAELLKQHPTKKYLNHLAVRKVDPSVSRRLERFSILYLNGDGSNLDSDFRDVYEKCRKAIMSIYYNRAIGKNSEFYDPFIGLCIMFMTINLIHSKYLEKDRSRDFYDAESVKYIYDAYGVPFYTEIPFEYHKKIVKHMNILLSKKGSSKVFFDMFALFNFESIEIAQYYIMKSRRRDETGKLVVSDSAAEMYKLFFGKVPIGKSPLIYLNDPSNQSEYDQITARDPYWFSDQALMDKLYNNDFNFLESKYLGVETMIDLTKILFETCYFVKMIEDNRNSLMDADIFVNFLGKEIPIFNIIIYLASLLCRINGFTGNIPGTLPSLYKVYGYNYQADIGEIQNFIYKEIETNPFIAQDEAYIKNLVANMIPYTTQDVEYVYQHIYDLRAYLDDKLSNAGNRRVYDAYKHLEEVLMFSQVQRYVFDLNMGPVNYAYEYQFTNQGTGYCINDFITVDDFVFMITEIDLDTGAILKVTRNLWTGTEPKDFTRVVNGGHGNGAIIKVTSIMTPTAYSYENLLGVIDPDLFSRINTPGCDFEGDLDNLLILLENTFQNLRYIHFTNDPSIGILMKHMFKLLMFFKSAKAELLNYRVTFTIRIRNMNNIKWIVDMNGLFETLRLNDRYEQIDLLLKIFEKISLRDDLFEQWGTLYDKIMRIGETRVDLTDDLLLLEDLTKRLREILNLLNKECDVLLLDFFAEPSEEKNKILDILELTDLTDFATKVIYRDPMWVYDALEWLTDSLRTGVVKSPVLREEITLLAADILLSITRGKHKICDTLELHDISDMATTVIYNTPMNIREYIAYLVDSMKTYDVNPIKFKEYSTITDLVKGKLDETVGDIREPLLLIDISDIVAQVKHYSDNLDRDYMIPQDAVKKDSETISKSERVILFMSDIVRNTIESIPSRDQVQTILDLLDGVFYQMPAHETFSLPVDKLEEIKDKIIKNIKERTKVLEDLSMTDMIRHNLLHEQGFIDEELPLREVFTRMHEHNRVNNSVNRTSQISLTDHIFFPAT